MKKWICLVICTIMAAAMASCKRSDSVPDTIPEETAAETTSLEKPAANCAPDAFEQSLIDYLWLNGYYDEDFVVSPTAFRASLCLAAVGAEGTTRTELVNAAGFDGMDALHAWYQCFRNAGTVYPCAASVWNDREQLGVFTDTYLTQLQEVYGAEAFTYSEDALTGSIDSWLNAQTGGQIISAQKDVSGAASVLVSTAYVTTPWQEDFSVQDGAAVELTGEFLYAEENGTQLLVLPMQGALSLVCFSGSRTEQFDKLAALEMTRVHAVLPAFDMTSGFDASVLLNFLLTRGVSGSLDGQTANFYQMCQDSDWFLQEMIQTAGFSVQAGASVTADTTAVTKEFTVNGMFSFMVVYEFGKPEQQVLLYGQRMI